MDVVSPPASEERLMDDRLSSPDADLCSSPLLYPGEKRRGKERRGLEGDRRGYTSSADAIPPGVGRVPERTKRRKNASPVFRFNDRRRLSGPRLAAAEGPRAHFDGPRRGLAHNSV